MAGKTNIPFNEASSTFALEGEPSPANLALAVMEVDQEAEHIAKTILQVMIQAHPSNAAYSPLAFDVQYSSDNSAWTTSWSVTTPNTWVGGEIRTFTKP